MAHWTEDLWAEPVANEGQQVEGGGAGAGQAAPLGTVPEDSAVGMGSEGPKDPHAGEAGHWVDKNGDPVLAPYGTATFLLAVDHWQPDPPPGSKYCTIIDVFYTKEGDPAPASFEMDALLQEGWGQWSTGKAGPNFTTGLGPSHDDPDGNYYWAGFRLYLTIVYDGDWELCDWGQYAFGTQTMSPPPGSGGVGHSNTHEGKDFAGHGSHKDNGDDYSKKQAHGSKDGKNTTTIFDPGGTFVPDGGSYSISITFFGWATGSDGSYDYDTITISASVSQGGVKSQKK